MKRLTMNQVARASLKANKKAYRSLMITVFLTVYLVTVASLCCYGTWLARQEKTADKVGYIDCFILGSPEVTDEQLRQSGLFSRIGHVYLSAQIGETGIYTGFYDEEGSELLHRRCVQGRFPEKEGEIAIEQSALEIMRLDLAIGDSVTWDMNPINGVSEERTYTLTGILNEQTSYLDVSNMYLSSDSVTAWPAALVSSEEQGYTVGNLQINRMMTYAPFVFFRQVEQFSMKAEPFFQVFAVSRHYGSAVGWDPTAEDLANAVVQMFFWLILGLCLLLATGIGISGAMESILAKKTEEIGMLRAAGATRRQITRLFGRDAWIIALISLPAGAGAGILTAWGISLLSSDEILFGFSPWLILPVLGVSALCIFLSSRMPLRRASKQPPMGVLRDTAMLRKARRFRTKTQFKASRLIAGRQTFLHPFRQAGAAVMIALMLTGAFFTVELGLASVRNSDDQYDFSLSVHSWHEGGVLSFSEMAEQKKLTDQDLQQIAEIPEVDQIRFVQTGEVNLVLRGEITPYLQDTYVGEEEILFTDENGQTSTYIQKNPINVSLLYGSLDYLLLETEPEMDSVPFGDPWSTYNYYHRMKTVQQVTGTDGRLFPTEVIMIDPGNSIVRNAVQKGTISAEKLDSGEEVLVYAPDQYVGRKLKTREGEYSYISTRRKETGHDVEWIAENHNDYFYPGQRLELLQLVDQDPTNIIYHDEDKNYERYARMEQRNASAAVGAVLSGDMLLDTMLSPECVSILTTRSGAQTLGIVLRNPMKIKISLGESVDEDTEEAIQKRLEQIAMRADMSVFNNLKYHRESRQKYRQFIALFIGIVVLFFAVSVAMQVGNIGRQIRADQRMIGTMRAVGADSKALLGCYLLPVLVACVTGLALGTGFFLLMKGLGDQMFPAYYPEVILPLFILLSVLCCFCCIAGVRTRLRQLLRQSVVENIREL